MMADDELNGLTEGDLRARLQAEDVLAAELNQRIDQAKQRQQAAVDRQAMRQLLEERRSNNNYRLALIEAYEQKTSEIECDRFNAAGGADSPQFGKSARPATVSETAPTGELLKSSVSFTHGLSEKEFVWEVRGLTWLPHALSQEGTTCTWSHEFFATSGFRLVFSPGGGALHADPEGDDYLGDYVGHTGTLALLRAAQYRGVCMEASFYIKRSDGEWIQWGSTKREAFCNIPDDMDPKCAVIAPDLDVSPDRKGLFGLSFDELLRSEYVTNDALEVKVVVKEIVTEAHEDFKYLH